jgi:hypothetical protein
MEKGVSRRCGTSNEQANATTCEEQKKTEEETRSYATANDLWRFRYQDGTPQIRPSVWEPLRPPEEAWPSSFLQASTRIGHGCHELCLRREICFAESKERLGNQKHSCEMVLSNCGSRMFQIELAPTLWAIAIVNMNPAVRSWSILSSFESLGSPNGR